MNIRRFVTLRLSRAVAFVTLFAAPAVSAQTAAQVGSGSSSASVGDGEGASVEKSASGSATNPGDDGGFRRGAGHRVSWNEAHKRFGVGNAALVGIAVTTSISAFVVGPDTSDPYTTHNSFDEGARDLIRAPSRRSRQLGEDTSDVLLGLTISQAFIGDALVNAGWYRDSPDVGVQIGLITGEAMMMTLAIHTLSNLAARERPFGRTCGTELDPDTANCSSDHRYRSFFSGHTSLSFTAATVSCVHQAQFSLYGAGASGYVPCVTGMAFAGATGALRVVADQHYASDVLVGAFVGTGVGLAVPLVLHYRERPNSKLEPDGFVVGLAPHPGGAQVYGTF